VLVAFARASLFRGGAGGALEGAGTSKDVLDKELLLESPILLLFGASCSLNSSVGCVFVLEAFASSTPGETLAFPFLLESFRAGRSD